MTIAFSRGLTPKVSDPEQKAQNSAYRLPVGWRCFDSAFSLAQHHAERAERVEARWGGEGRKTLPSPDFPTGEERFGIVMLTGARLERLREAMQAVEDRVVGNNKRPSQSISRKGDKVIQKEIEKELKRLVTR